MTNDHNEVNDNLSPELLTCVPISPNGSSAPPPLTSASTRASSRKNRVYVFREFLFQTYGSSYFSKGSVVLDVAGGKGDLSWLLVNVDEMDSVVADPRLTKHNSQLKSIHYLKQNPEEALVRSIPNRPTYQPLAALLPRLEGKERFTSPPRHLRILVDNLLVHAVRHYLDSQNDEDWGVFWNDALERALEARPLEYKEDDSTTRKRQITDAMKALNVILSLKLIIGFHPDQACEACMDLATLLKIPFCVVPCCVFPSEFPHRKTQDGERVRKYEQFIPYLQKKYPKIQTSILTFHETKTARNIVLYTLPDDVSCADR